VDWLRGLIVAALLLGGTQLASAQQRQQEAKEAFFAGKAAYEAKDYEKALEHFRRSYTLGEVPALLYNIASTLQNLNRPGEAAATLRDFLKVRPDDPERVELERRIENLERAQKIVDRDAAQRAKLLEEETARQRREAEAVRLRGPDPGWVAESEVARRVSMVKDREQQKRRRTLGIALGVTFGAIAVGTAITLGIVLSREDRKDFDYDRVTVTR